MIPYGALTVLQFPLPVLAFLNGEYGATCIGKIEAIEDGWDEGYATMVVMGVADPTALPTDEKGDTMYGVGMDLDTVACTFSEDSDLMVFDSARLMAISVTPNPAFPKARLEFR
jgi:hypothetical protein